MPGDFVIASLIYAVYHAAKDTKLGSGAHSYKENKNMDLQQRGMFQYD